MISGTTTVGTSPTCDITVVDDEMDDHHCTIELDEASGVFFVRPTKSANGTYVKLSEKTPFELNFGDVLRLSDSRLSFGLARVCTLFKTLDDLFISTAMFLFQIKDLESKTKKLEALGGYRSVWERYKNYRKRAGKRNDPPIDEKGWKCEYPRPRRNLPTPSPRNIRVGCRGGAAARLYGYPRHLARSPRYKAPESLFSKTR